MSAKIFPMTRTTVVNTPTDGPRKAQERKQPKTPTTYPAIPRKALDEPNSRAMVQGLTRPQAEYLRMVARARPDDSEAERAWIKQWLFSISDDVAFDGYGNVVLRIGDSPICWTSHTDTVHWRQGWQSINYSRNGTVTLAASSGANCLGADCTSGAWLMRQMALQRVPGLYVWFRAEESGALGSTWAARNTPELFANSKAAISLDRRGYSDVITHQGGARTASDDFAKSLATVLNGAFAGGEKGAWKPGYKPSSNGVFTDSKQLVGVVGECTNISVGYFGQHSRTESQNLPFLCALLDALKVVGEHPDLLRYTREAGEEDPTDYTYRRYALSDWTPGNVQGGYWGDYMSEEDQATRDGAYHVEPAKTSTTTAGYTVTDADREAWGHPKPKNAIGDMARELTDLCKMYPDVAAELLLGWGVTVEDFADEVYTTYGVVRVS